MTSTDLLTVTGVTLVLALFSLFISWRLFRRSRTDIFWRRRREAGQRGWRMFLLGMVLLVLSGFACAGTLALTVLSGDRNDPGTTDAAQVTTSSVIPTETATSSTAERLESSLTPQFTPIPLRSEEVVVTQVSSDMLLPTQTLAPTPTPFIIVVTSTPGPVPSLTPYPTFTPLASTTALVAPVTPRPNARLTITALDDQVSAEGEPIAAQTVFEAGTTRLYYFVRFNYMAAGVRWSRYLYYEDEVIAGGEYLWGPEMSGHTYFFFGSDTGFEPGNYEIRLFIGNYPEPASVMTFTVSP